eukprot:TRINITY_DN3756_c0_g5_i1.p1 TRINITY_DN3756_c0_g5~~TRINITY_DN3756_c0_g5_i1.p1  ORF type:complete len:353 (+),score=54.79 TRINITY_DN3756_c0_g5_i1:103-1161(+)
MRAEQKVLTRRGMKPTEQLLSDAAAAPQNSGVGAALSQAELRKVWEAVGHYSADQLAQGRGVCVAGFVVFTLSCKRDGQGNLASYPVLFLHPQFCVKYHITAGQQQPFPKAVPCPVQRLPLAAIAQKAGLSKDRVSAGIGNVVSCLGESLYAGHCYDLNFGVARLMLQRDRSAAVFSEDLLSRIRHLDSRRNQNANERRHFLHTTRGPVQAMVSGMLQDQAARAATPRPQPGSRPPSPQVGRSATPRPHAGSSRPCSPRRVLTPRPLCPNRPASPAHRSAFVPSGGLQRRTFDDIAKRHLPQHARDPLRCIREAQNERRCRREKSPATACPGIGEPVLDVGALRPLRHVKSP